MSIQNKTQNSYYVEKCASFEKMNQQLQAQLAHFKQQLQTIKLTNNNSDHLDSRLN